VCTCNPTDGIGCGKLAVRELSLLCFVCCMMSVAVLRVTVYLT